ncbi:hypothetical protein [Promicromonospora sp. NPDC050880]|uniref:hypothetical protein n=1 Tax=Promicromonospora sp. NPDC050880 TaxID=3364406 RepID=UPI00379D968F
MSTLFERLTKPKARRMAEDALHLSARAAAQLDTARTTEAGFSPQVMDLLSRATTATSDLDAAVRRELTDLAEGRQ